MDLYECPLWRTQAIGGSGESRRFNGATWPTAPGPQPRNGADVADICMENGTRHVDNSFVVLLGVGAVLDF